MIDPKGLVGFGYAAKRIGKWGLKKLGRLSRDETKRRFRKERKDVIGSKKMLKKMAKNKGKGKTGRPIIEKHGEGNLHVHPPDRPGGHGFVGSLAALISLLDYVDPISLMSGELSNDDTLFPEDANGEPIFPEMYPEALTSPCEE